MKIDDNTAKYEKHLQHRDSIWLLSCMYVRHPYSPTPSIAPLHIVRQGIQIQTFNREFKGVISTPCFFHSWLASAHLKRRKGLGR